MYYNWVIYLNLLLCVDLCYFNASSLIVICTNFILIFKLKMYYVYHLKFSVKSYENKE